MPLAQDVGCATCPSATLTMSMQPQFGFGAPHPEPVAEFLDRWHHGHILNTLDEKIFHRQVSALIGHWHILNANALQCYEDNFNLIYTCIQM